jgi:hypothetical protein
LGYHLSGKAYIHLISNQVHGDQHSKISFAGKDCPSEKPARGDQAILAEIPALSGGETMSMRWLPRLGSTLMVSLFVACCNAVVCAQTFTTARIAGTVIDIQGAAIVNAEVSAENSFMRDKRGIAPMHEASLTMSAVSSHIRAHCGALARAPFRSSWKRALPTKVSPHNQ